MGTERSTLAGLAVRVGHVERWMEETRGMLREVLDRVGDVRERMATREQVAKLEDTVQAHATEVAKVAKLEVGLSEFRKEMDTRVRSLEDEVTRAKTVARLASLAAGTGGLGIGAALVRFFGSMP